MNEPGITRSAADRETHPAAVGDEGGGAKWRSVAILFLSQVLAMSLWFVSAAVLVDLMREIDLVPWRQAALSSAVQAGFVAGALAFAIFGWSDRYDPRRVFAIAAVAGGCVNALLLVVPADSNAAMPALARTRCLTGSGSNWPWPGNTASWGARNWPRCPSGNPGNRRLSTTRTSA